MNKEELIKIFNTIKEPDIYETHLINEKTKLIKKIQKKYNFNFNEIKNLYKIDYNKLKILIENLT